ncbi:SUKH-3 domain-containing protein [Tepidibacter hydrothermalis]|uniref:SUKH-3 domain-containing protein n=1 Tax=Tepidibacter hydrothermalis TaxID=3036126 RepID=A0ABY8E7T7_9FIRM|nr:SUKH-3 domain-containing protein [Tepidibacter hydrothermalis]WFD08958.1 SUKH-3 domain-containing protein [Tepidibacter hydrothermalis]
MLLEETKRVLKKAGWYEGRKIDISEHIKFLQNMGYEVFDALKKFLEEYGDLKIVLEYEPFDEDDDENTMEYSTYIKDIIGPYKKNINQDKKVGEKTIPIAEIANGEILAYISESGEFYTYEGLLNSNDYKFWNSRFGDQRGERPLTWRELGKNDNIDWYLKNKM